MKTIIYAVAFLLGAVLSFIGCSEENQPAAPLEKSTTIPNALHKSSNREFTGSMQPTWADPNAGFTKYPDGKIIMRGSQQKIAVNVTFSDGLSDLISGTGDLELNCNADINSGTGEFWGKLVVTPASSEAEGGQWQLTWHGKATLGPTGWVCPLKELGHGEGGSLTGVQVFLENVISATPDFSYWTGAMKGYVKTH